jgi:hypothetical protein
MNDLGRWLRAEWDRAAAVALVVLGVIFVAVGYNGVSTSPYVAEELAYLASGAVGGLFLLGCGATLWLSADLHDEWRKLDRIEAAIRGEHATATDEEGSAAEDDSEANDGSNGVAETNGKTNGKSKAAQIRVGRTTRRETARLATRLQPRVAPPGEGNANIALLGGITAAAIVMLVGWHRAAATGDSKVAFSGLAISLAGAVAASVFVAAYTFWLRRSVANRQVELLRPYLIADMAAQPAFVAGTPQRAADGDVDENEKVLVGTGLTHFHRPGCPATAGVKTRLTSRTRVKAGVSPCGICGAR